MKLSNIQNIVLSKPLVSVSIAITILFACVAYWRSQEVVKRQGELKVVETELNRLNDNIRYAQKLDVHYEKIKQGNENIRSRLVDPADVATNQQYFYKLESDTGVKLTELQQISSKQRGRGPASSSIYNIVSYSVSVQGEFVQLLSFLRRLESGSRFCRIVTGSLVMEKFGEGPGGPNPVLTLSINLDFLGT